MIGLTFGEPPKFARRYAKVGEEILRAAREYCEDVRGGRFPSDAESYHAPAESRAPAVVPKHR
jgi:3-methyl-2-oxobutanoate hydroxymethyltransferase